MTFSIIAYDPETDSWGLAVASRITAIGSVVPHGRWGTGIVASQALVPNYGRDLLIALAQDEPTAAVQEVLSQDPYLEHRQIALIDRFGDPHFFQGQKVIPEAGHVATNMVSAQGNMLVNLEMLEIMVNTYVNDTSDDLGDRLLHALEAGEQAGGDRRVDRPWYSAALLIVEPCQKTGVTPECKVDLRVDQSPTPIQDLWDLYRMREFERGDIQL